MLNEIQNIIRNQIQKYRYYHYEWAKKWYMGRYDHIEGYRKLMRYRINHHGPEKAVGGFDKGIGKLQLNFLCNKGLGPSNSLLDLGCGSLRGGEYFIDYLNRGNYTGMDISAKAIQAGTNRLEELVTKKNPTFVVNDDLTFQNNDLANSYDYAIAQSVFTHLPPKQIEECFSHIGTVVDGKFYATFFDEPKSSPKNFGYDPDTLFNMAEQHDHSVELISRDDYPHPRGQRMMEITIK